MKRSDLLLEEIRVLSSIGTFCSDLIGDYSCSLRSILSEDDDAEDFEDEDISRSELVYQFFLSIRSWLCHDESFIKPKCADDYLKYYKDGWSVNQWVTDLRYRYGQSRSTIFRNFKKFGIEPRKVTRFAPDMKRIIEEGPKKFGYDLFK